MKKITSILTILILTLLLSATTPELSANTNNLPEEKHEFRAAWASHLIGSMSAYTSEAQFKTRANEILDILEFYNYNALIMHMRTHNNAYYVSELSPKAAAFAQVNFNTFDPMLWFIEETQRRGIEFHAWLNPYRLGTSHVGSIPAANPASNPANILSHGGGSILNPGLPHVRDFVSDTIVEILDRYPVDAIHFDDYFYINLGANGATSGSNTILNEADQSTFETYGAGFNTSSAASKADWRRHQVNLMVESVSQTIKDFNEANNRHVQFGISPTGIYKNGNGVVTYDSNGHAITNGSDTGGQTHYSSYLFADSVHWAEEGWIDYLIPQSYWADSHPIASYTKIMRWWNDVFKNLDANLYSGIGVYMADSTSNTYGWKSNAFEMKEQLEYIQTLEHVQGASLYSYNYIDSAYKNSSSFSSTQVQNAKDTWSNIAVLPELRSMTPINPGVVTNLKHENGTLSFNGTPDAKQYYIYRSSTGLTFSQEEIVKVIRTESELITYVTNDTNNTYQYGVRALSYTNTLGDASLKNELVVTDGAAIRVNVDETNQALRFYANMDLTLNASEQGFYFVEGMSTNQELSGVIQTPHDNTFTINGKSVTKVEVLEVDSHGNFDAVIKDITPNKFSQVYTAIAYYVKDGETVLSFNQTTRSILEVAYRMTYLGDADEATELITTDLRRLTKTEFGELVVATSFELDHIELKAAFLKDWNTKFSLSLTDIQLGNFYDSAVEGKVSDPASLAGSRLYQFFNDSVLKAKWGWLLDYIEAVDAVIWPSRQVVAIKGDGTNPLYTNIHEGRHVITTLIGFFNASYAYDEFPTNNFTNPSMYLNLVNYHTNVLSKPTNDIYLYVGDTITLPTNNQTGFKHYLIDGVIYQAGANYTLGAPVRIETVFE